MASPGADTPILVNDSNTDKIVRDSNLRYAADPWTDTTAFNNA